MSKPSNPEILTSLTLTGPTNWRALAVETGQITFGEGGEGERGEAEAEERAALLERLDAGERVTLNVVAQTFRQSSTPRPLPEAQKAEANANFTFFAAEELDGLAQSFVGRPLLADHRGDLSSKMGKIIASSATEEEGGESIFVQSFEIKRRSAVEAFLDGTIETFSIGARADSDDASAMCTVCECDFFSIDCRHMPGDVVKLDGSEDRVIVEVALSGFVGRETSAVNFPAVQGTQIDSIATLAEQKRALTKLHRSDDHMSDQKLTEAKLEADSLRLELSAAKEGLAEASATIATLRAELAAVAAGAKSEKIQVLQARALSGEGFGGALFSKGDAREAYFLSVAKNSLEGAEAYLGTLTPSVVGAELQSSAEQKKLAAHAGLTPADVAWCKDNGMSLETFKTHNGIGN